MATGTLTSSQKDVWSFGFDASDPSVNFTDGVYQTLVAVPYGACLNYSAIKYFQDLSAYPPFEVDIILNAVSINTLITPFVNPVNNWKLATHFQGSVFPIPDPIQQLNPLGDFIIVSIGGMTGSGITAFSFEAYFEISTFGY